jgi:hypothetical protein
MITGKTILSQIIGENVIGAKKSITTLLMQKAKVFLEDKRRCLASVTYSPCSEANIQGNCGCDEQIEEEEKLTDKQKKLDKNKNGELDSQDFIILRNQKKKEKKNT